MRRSFTFLVLGLTLSGSLPAANAALTCPVQLVAEDRREIESTIEKYRTSWLNGDATGVQQTFEQSAVLLPAHGAMPVVGLPAIVKYWWPQDAPPTKVLRLDITVEEIGGDGCYAFVRGSDTVEWQTVGSEKQGSFSTYLNVMRKQPDKSWRILQHMWDARR